MLKNKHCVNNHENNLDNQRDLDKFKSYLSQFRSLSTATKQILIENITIDTLPARSIILERNHFENELRYITNGLVKITYHNGLEYYVYDFRDQNNLLCDTVSLFYKQLSHFSMETITNCSILKIDRAKLISILQENRELQELMILMLNTYMNKYHNRQCYFRSLSADERYSQFCKEFPNAIKYAKLRDIASYLCMTQQSLSRIRKSIQAREKYQ